MSRGVTIEDGDTRRTVAEGEFPLALGGKRAAIAVPCAAGEQPAARFGLAEDRLFIQAADAAQVFCNGDMKMETELLGVIL